LIYRTDYLLAIILAGAALGFLLARRLEAITSTRLARAFYVAVTGVTLLRILTVTGGLILPNPGLWTQLGNATGDLGGLLFGALFGVAARRERPSELVYDPTVFSALCLATGLGFVLSGFIKAFYMPSMTDFFTQSGYPLAFLKLIMTLEVVAGVGMLIPWAVPAATAALAIDMFGAVYTHVHDGDTLNDNCTGAFGALLRLTVIATLWALRRPAAATHSVRQRLIGIGIAAILCLLAAIGGGMSVRALNPPKSPPRAAFRFEPRFEPPAFRARDVSRPGPVAVASASLGRNCSSNDDQARDYPLRGDEGARRSGYRGIRRR
jgi:uncharacterized membrane protein YphA (DoxX/SURF4 family)